MGVNPSQAKTKLELKAHYFKSVFFGVIFRLLFGRYWKNSYLCIVNEKR